MPAQAGNEEDAAVDVSLYSHRWRRWLHPNPRSMDSNRASQEQDQVPPAEEPSFPGLLSAEDTDNSSQIEVGGGRKDQGAVWNLFFLNFLKCFLCPCHIQSFFCSMLMY